MTILVVDDEMMVRIGMQSLLNLPEQGIELVGCADNGKIALGMIREKKPDIVITDLKMPEMDGLELIREIRRRRLPIGIIVLSSYDEFDLVKQAMKLGADEYLLKLQLSQENMLAAVWETWEKLEKNRKDELGEAGGSVEHRQSKRSVKTLLSDLLAEIDEIPDTEQFPLIEDGQMRFRYSVCIWMYCAFSGEEDSMVYEMVESISEDIFKEQFTAYCFKVENCEYILTVFSDVQDPDSLLVSIRGNCCRCINMIFDLLNVSTSMCIGSIETSAGTLKVSLKNASKVYYKVFLKQSLLKNSKSVLDYQSEKAKLTAIRDGEPPADAGGYAGLERQFQYIQSDPQAFNSFPQPIKIAVEFLRQNYHEDITLQQTAEKAGFNPSYFSTLFSSSTGITFTDFFTKLRLNRAKELLKTTNMKIYEIAEAIGYRNSYYFSRIFRKFEGVTPFEYRNL